MRHRFALVPVVLAVGLLVAPHAFAQSAMITSENPHSSAGVTTFTFSKQNCEDGAAYDVVLNGQDPAAAMQVWVTVEGQCETPEARDTATQSCYQVDSLTRTGVAEGETISVPAQALAAAGIPGLSACEDTGTAASRALTVYFLYDVSPGATVASFTTVNIDLDFVGPNPPEGVSVTSSSTTALSVSFDVGNSDAEVFRAYCEPAGVLETPTTAATGAGGSTSTTTSGAGGATSMSFGQGHKTYGGVGGAGGAGGGVGGVGGAGGSGGSGGAIGGAGGTGGTGGVMGTGGTTSGTGGTGATSSSGGSSSGSDDDCDDAEQLVQGQLAPAALECSDEDGQSALPATVGSGFKYWVAVAGVDRVGNVGPISEPVCNAPVDVNDFWQDYAEVGKGGGGCTCGMLGLSATPIAFGAWIAGLALLLVRRRENA